MAAKEECRGRQIVPLTDEQAATMPEEQLRPIVANNEQVEQQCGAKAPNPSGRAKGAS